MLLREKLILVGLILFVLCACKDGRDNRAKKDIQSPYQDNTDHVMNFVNHIAPSFGSISTDSVLNVELPMIQDWLISSGYIELANQYVMLGEEERVRGVIVNEKNGRSILFSEVPKEIQENSNILEYILLSKLEGEINYNEGDLCFLKKCLETDQGVCRCIAVTKMCPSVDECGLETEILLSYTDNVDLFGF